MSAAVASRPSPPAVSDRAPARCPGCDEPNRPADAICAACGRRLRPLELALRLEEVVVRFRAVAGADGWHAEGCHGARGAAPWRRLSDAHFDPHACLGHAVGRTLRWLVAARNVDDRQDLVCLAHVDGLAGAFRIVAGPAAEGGWPWRAMAEPLPGGEAMPGALSLAELWDAAGGGTVMGLGRDRGASAASAVARALARVDAAAWD